MTTETRYVLVTGANVDRLFSLAEGPDADQIVLAASTEEVERGLYLGQLVHLPLCRTQMLANVGIALAGRRRIPQNKIKVAYLALNQCDGKAMYKFAEGDPNPIHGWKPIVREGKELFYFIPEPAHVAVSEH